MLHAHNPPIEPLLAELTLYLSDSDMTHWAVIIVGAFIGLSTSFFFRVEDPRLHDIEVLLLATFIGLIIFMIFALDRPFRGDLGVQADPYQLVYDQLMKP